MKKVFLVVLICLSFAGGFAFYFYVSHGRAELGSASVPEFVLSEIFDETRLEAQRADFFGRIAYHDFAVRKFRAYAGVSKKLFDAFCSVSLRGAPVPGQSLMILGAFADLRWNSETSIQEIEDGLRKIKGIEKITSEKIETPDLKDQSWKISMNEASGPTSIYLVQSPEALSVRSETNSSLCQTGGILIYQVPRIYLNEMVLKGDLKDTSQLDMQSENLYPADHIKSSPKNKFSKDNDGLPNHSTEECEVLKDLRAALEVGKKYRSLDSELQFLKIATFDKLQNKVKVLYNLEFNFPFRDYALDDRYYFEKRLGADYKRIQSLYLAELTPVDDLEAQKKSAFTNFSSSLIVALQNLRKQYGEENILWFMDSYYKLMNYHDLDELLPIKNKKQKELLVCLLELRKVQRVFFQDLPDILILLLNNRFITYQLIIDYNEVQTLYSLLRNLGEVHISGFVNAICRSDYKGTKTLTRLLSALAITPESFSLSGVIAVETCRQRVQ